MSGRVLAVQKRQAASGTNAWMRWACFHPSLLHNHVETFVKMCIVCALGSGFH
jgi:hypothetical protein